MLFDMASFIFVNLGRLGGKGAHGRERHLLVNIDGEFFAVFNGG